MSNMQAAAAKFFTAKTFAVAGASSLTRKFGYKIFVWYQEHDLNAIPLNPNQPTITTPKGDVPTVASPSKVPNPKETSLSIITPPAVTAKLLEEAKEAGILAVWLQPGTFTDAELEYALREFPGAAIGGFEKGTVGGEGWCVLVDGDEAMDQAAKLKRQV